MSQRPLSAGIKPPVGGVQLFPILSQPKIEEPEVTSVASPRNSPKTQTTSNTTSNTSTNSNTKKSHPKTPHKKKNNKDSLLSIAATAATETNNEEVVKLQHITVNRVAKPPGNRRPPSRRPMTDRVTVNQDVPDEDLSLVAKKTPPPSNLNVTVNTNKPPLPPKPQIVEPKRKTELQVIGEKKVMRIFLDNKGVGFKTVQVNTNDNMYELCAVMEKKIQLMDLTGFGIYEVRDQRDVRLIDPEETINEVMENWKGDALFKLVYKKALGECAKKYYNKPSKPSTPSLPSKPSLPPSTPSLPSKPSLPPSTPSLPPSESKPPLPSKPEVKVDSAPDPKVDPKPVRSSSNLQTPSDRILKFTPTANEVAVDNSSKVANNPPSLPSKPEPKSTTQPIPVNYSSEFVSTPSPSPLPSLNSPSPSPSQPSSPFAKSDPTPLSLPLPEPPSPSPLSSSPLSSTTSSSSSSLSSSAGGKPPTKVGMSRRVVPIRQHALVAPSSPPPSPPIDLPPPLPSPSPSPSSLPPTPSSLPLPPTPSVPSTDQPTPADNNNAAANVAGGPQRTLSSSTRRTVQSAIIKPIQRIDSPPNPLSFHNNNNNNNNTNNPLKTDDGANNNNDNNNNNNKSTLVRPASSGVIKRPAQTLRNSLGNSPPRRAPPSRNVTPNRSNLSPINSPPAPAPSDIAPIAPSSLPLPPTPSSLPSPPPSSDPPSADVFPFQSKSPKLWDVHDVGDWISHLGFPTMRDCFIENFISGKELLELTMEELKDDLGVSALGARKAIMREIANLQEL